MSTDRIGDWEDIPNDIEYGISPTTRIPLVAGSSVPPDSLPQAKATEVAALWPLYGWYRARQLEGTLDLPQSCGCWPVSGNRVRRYFGELPKDLMGQHGSWEQILTKRNDRLAARMRIAYYMRVSEVNEIVSLVRRGQVVNTSVWLTREWQTTETGNISTVGNAHPVRATHQIGIYDYDLETHLFKFINSWGADWGNNGYGMLSYSYLQRFLIEAWVAIGYPEKKVFNAKKAPVLVTREHDDFREGVHHSLEYTNFHSGERIGWLFARETSDLLIVEELFVWPPHRGNGIAKQLVNEFKKLRHRRGKPAIYVIPLGDPNSREALDIISSLSDSRPLEPQDNRIQKFRSTGVLVEP